MVLQAAEALSSVGEGGGGGGSRREGLVGESRGRLQRPEGLPFF